MEIRLYRQIYNNIYLVMDFYILYIIFYNNASVCYCENNHIIRSHNDSFYIKCSLNRSISYNMYFNESISAVLLLLQIYDGFEVITG